MQESKDINQSAEMLQNICEQLYKGYEDKYQQYLSEKTKSEEIVRKKDKLLNVNAQLKQNILKTIQAITKQRQIISKQNKHSIKQLKQRHEKEKVSRQTIKKDQYFYKISVINFDMKEIQSPQSLKVYQQKLNEDFKYEKESYENDITKLKIMIKLTQINLEDAQSQDGKSKKAKN